jgi:ABC-type phosphate transport system permease subunit
LTVFNPGVAKLSSLCRNRLKRRPQKGDCEALFLIRESAALFLPQRVFRPMSALPLIIYEFARSPYAEQQKLAWTGALILTLAVLGMSILARVLSASVRQK